MFEIDSTQMIDTNNSTTEVLDRVENRVVLDRAAHDDTGLAATGSARGGSAAPEHRQIVGLGAAARIDDVAGISAEQLCEFVARFVDGPPGIAGPSMRARGIGEPFGQEWQHRLDRFGSHRPCSRMVEVGTHLSKGTGAGARRPVRC